MAYELTTWKPFRDLAPFSDFDRMRREMDRLWDSFVDGTVERRAKEESVWLPSVDVSETKNDLVIKAELPGMDPKDIDITLSDGHLMIKGQKKHEKEEKDEDYHFVERSYGSFVRAVHLPKEVKHDKINASYKNGVLKIVLPKSEEAKTKEVKIKVE
jgi:HSP20 family protein